MQNMGSSYRCTSFKMQRYTTLLCSNDCTVSSLLPASPIIVSLRSTSRRVTTVVAAAAAAAAAITITGAHRDYHIRVHNSILFRIIALNRSYMFTALFPFFRRIFREQFPQ